MGKGVERVGETGLKAEWEFPDETARDDFEIAFRGWMKQYQQAASAQRLVGALAAKANEDADDTEGFLITLKNVQLKGKSYGDIYLNMI
jgi:hypothetical protein